MSCDVEQAADAYGSYFETLRPDNVDRLHDLAAPDMRFVDPFNDMRGVNQVVRLLHRMFEDATEVSFRMLDQACQGDRCFLRWEFFCRPRRLAKGRPWRIEGVSMVRFDSEGRVVEHIDYWDAAKHFYGQLPLIGTLLRRIGRRLQLSPISAMPEESDRH
jgi:steroid delta-isomerase